MSITTAQEALNRLSNALGIPPISHIIKRGRDHETARFTIVFEDHREVRIGTAKTFTSQAELGRALFVAIDVFPQRLKNDKWMDVLHGLAHHGAITVEEVEGERFEDTVQEWITDYLDTGALDADRNGAAAQGLPFRDNGHIHLSANHLAKYVRREHSENIRLAELRQALTDLGFERETIYYQRAKRRASRSYYVTDAEAVIPTDDTS